MAHKQPEDSFCIVEFTTEDRATLVVPSAWVKYSEGSTFCAWPSNLTKSEAAQSIKRIDPPSTDWEEKLCKKVYPKKRNGVPFRKCTSKHATLYKDGSDGLDSEVSDSEDVKDTNGINARDTNKSCAKLFSKPRGYSGKDHKAQPPLKTARLESRDTQQSNLETGREPAKSSAPSKSKIIDESTDELAPREEQPGMNGYPNSNFADTPKINSLLHNNDSEDSSDSETEIAEEKVIGVTKEMDTPTTSTQKTDAFIDQQSIKLGNGPVTDYTVKRLFRWMLRTNVSLKELKKSNDKLVKTVADLRAQIEGKTLKTATTVIPGLVLPCRDPDDIKHLNEELEKGKVYADVVTYQSTKAAGNKSADIGYSLMALLMSPLCGVYFTYDGLHSKSQKLSIKSYANVYKALDESMATLVVKDSQGKVIISLSDIKKKAGRWLTTAETRLKKDEVPPKLPWIPKL